MAAEKTPELRVSAAILVHDGHILCMQRGPSRYSYIAYKYEFPGGKVEPGESFEQALARELMEEMGIELPVSPEQHYMTIEHTYPDFTITLRSYLCPVEDRTFERLEHLDHKWLPRERLFELDWVPADYPIVERLATR